jgi:nitrous oxidase accessory protein NosD
MQSGSKFAIAGRMYIQLVAGESNPSGGVVQLIQRGIRVASGGKIMKRTCLLISTIIFASVALADVRYVPGTYPTIQSGIDAAVNGDTVLVVDGEYTGEGNRDLDFKGKAILVTSENGPEATTIDCDGSESDPHRGFYFHSGEDTASVVRGFTITGGYACADEGGGAILCVGSSPAIEANVIKESTAWEYGGGISCWDYSSPTIKGNLIEGNSVERSDSRGGGVSCYSYSSPTIVDNTIAGNTALWHGGGIFCYYSSPAIVNNTIKGNTSIWGDGGGISCFNNSSPHIEGNLIVGNKSCAEGGGILCRDNSSPTILGNWIVQNTTAWGGGICCLYFGNQTIEDNVIAENEAYPGNGGGILCYTYSSSTLAGNTIVGNVARIGMANEGDDETISSPYSLSLFKRTLAGGHRPGTITDGGFGGGIACESAGDMTVLNSIVWANRADVVGSEIYVDGFSSLTVAYSNIKGGWEGEGNIDANPQFLLPGKRDLRLQWGSPCIDTGHPDSLDPDGTRSDMGAFSFDQSSPITIYLTPDTTVYHRYQNLGVTYTVINIDPDPITFSLRTDVYLPSGKPYSGNPVVGPKGITLPGGKTKQRLITHYIPGNAPYGVYTYATTISSVLFGGTIDEGGFEFVVEE